MVNWKLNNNNNKNKKKKKKKNANAQNYFYFSIKSIFEWLTMLALNKEKSE